MCPFVNKSDIRCATHWTLRNLTQTFSHCADRFTVCPVYRSLIRELCTNGQDRYQSESARGVLAAC